MTERHRSSSAGKGALLADLFRLVVMQQAEPSPRSHAECECMAMRVG